MSLASVLTKVSDVVLSGAGRKIISGLGISAFTYGGTQLIFGQAISLVQSYWSGLGSVFYIFGLSGADQALSMVLSAIAVRIAMNSAKIGFKKS